ncbi:MAG: ATP-binding cassette domain-containing protein [Bacteroidota bacterium]|nr:ATP-binding cassette domain-containing protein [Bacteroidota bacterium]
MNRVILSFDKITVRNLNGILFENLSFEIKKGEHWALIGASGTGKSALLSTIAGKFPIIKGKVERPLLEECVQDKLRHNPLFNWRKLIAHIEQKHNFRNLTNTKDFYYQQRFNSSDSEDAQTVKEYLLSLESETLEGEWNYDKIVERLNLKDLLDKQLFKLSNGETKRLRIAASLIKNPVLLLMDNPLTGLDLKAREDFDMLIEDIIESGITIIMVTSPNEIPDAITNVAVLESQAIVNSGPKAKLDISKIDFQETETINAKELQELLSLNDPYQYDLIVGMENVKVKYKEKVILNNINWNIRQGERWALLGHNGAGKSTLLSLINGDNPQAYANKITLFDKRRGTGESIWAIKGKIGFVSPELFQYFPVSMSCLQVIESGFYDTLGLFRPSSPAKAKIARQWMKVLELENHATTLFKNVSASTQRLCLLARALVKNPPLLIFDEPCQGLDSHQQKQFKQVIEAICAISQVSIIYVSHYSHEIPESVNHTLKLENGEVSAIV